jgi:hypothetical protein
MNCTKYSLPLISYDIVCKIILQESLQHLEDLTINPAWPRKPSVDLSLIFVPSCNSYAMHRRYMRQYTPCHVKIVGPSHQAPQDHFAYPCNLTLDPTPTILLELLYYSLHYNLPDSTICFREHLCNMWSTLFRARYQAH